MYQEVPQQYLMLDLRYCRIYYTTFAEFVFSSYFHLKHKRKQGRKFHLYIMTVLYYDYNVLEIASLTTFERIRKY